MTKRRNPQAVAAWSRHGGAHDPGSKKPTLDESTDIADGIDEALEAAEDDLLDIILDGAGTIEIDGETYHIEFEWDLEEGEDDDDE